MINKKFLIALAIFSFIFVNSANAAFFPNRDLIAPDSSFSFLQTWKESIQTFFTFGTENKAKQYLHLAEVRLDEYKKMLEKGKIEIADKILQKYEKQLNNALQKTEELKNKGQDIKDLSQKIEETVAKHLEVLQENLQKVPEQAKKGIENAIENSQKQVEKITGKKDETSGWKTYRNEKYGFELKYPVNYNTEQPTPDTDVFIIRIPQKQEYLQIQVLNTKPPLAENYRPNSAQLIGEVMIGGKKAIKYYTENPLGEGTLSGYPFTNYTIVLGDNKWININYYGKGSMVESFERVLSTFKFIEKTDTADWKTYRNEKYGFEVKYPATWQNPTERDFATYPESGIKDAFAVEFYKNTVNGKGVNGEGFFMIISKRDDLGYRDLSSGAGLPLNSTFSDFKKCSTPVSGVAIGVENYPAKKVYISPTDKCFQTGYWYVFQDGKYSYNIRSRSDGFACVGCDGEPTTKEKFPEFYQILSNFKFVPQ